jgi:aminoacrylate hydrolase
MPLAAGLHYELHGPEGAELLVLSSGLGGAGEYWAPNLPALTKHFRVLTYDQRGTGRSESDLQSALTLEDMAHDLLFLLDELGLYRVRMIGHALGGLIGLSLARMEPERIERLVVVNGWLNFDPLTSRCFDVRLALLRGSGPEAFFLAQPLFLYPPAWISAHDADLKADARGQLSRFTGADSIERRIAALRVHDPSDRIGEIRTPVLAVSAADDMLVPAVRSKALAEALPLGEHAALPAGGHACNIVDPEGFAALVLPWLQGQSLPGRN